jgi:hypothetical protein
LAKSARSPVQYINSSFFARDLFVYFAAKILHHPHGRRRAEYIVNKHPDLKAATFMLLPLIPQKKEVYLGEFDYILL